MVTLPREFTATRFPGYFWNTKTQKLYSLKVGGELRELKGPMEPNYFNKWHEPGYRVSHKGRPRVLGMSYLKKLKLEDSEIPVGE